MRTRTPRFAVAAFAIATVMLAAACSGSKEPAQNDDAAPHSGGDITVTLSAAWRTLDPAQLVSRPDRSVAKAIYDTLADYDENGNVIPSLAESFEPSNAGKTWVVALRSGVKFSDGTDFDAAALKAHFDRIADPASACPCAADIKSIQSVQVTDPTHLVIELAAPNAAFPSILAGPVGFVPSPAAVAKYGKDFATNPVGAGPFVVTKIEAGHEVALKKNPDYWQKKDGLPYLDTVTFKVVTDPQAQRDSLLSGGVDIVTFETAPGDQPVLATLKDQPNVDVMNLGSLGFRYVGLEVNKPPFNKLEARQAIAYATDTAAMSKAFRDFYVPLQGIFATSSPANQEQVPGWPSYDLERAKSLVSDLGGLSFELIVWGIPGDLQMAQILQAQWKKAGIDIKITPVEFAALSERNFAHDFQATLWGMSPGYDPDENARQLVACKSPKNYMDYCSNEVDKLIAQGKAELDAAKRWESYQQINTILARDLPVISLLNSTKYFGHAKDVHGLQKLADGQMRLTQVWLSK